MRSKTKFYVNESEIHEIFSSAGLGVVDCYSELTGGEFNSAYSVYSGGKAYVLKVAPIDNSTRLTYEADIMSREVSFYRLVGEKTQIRIPKIHLFDESKSIINTEYFIMEKLQSKPLSDCRINRIERNAIHHHLGRMVAELDNIKGSAYGYEQNGLESSWSSALKSMVNSLVRDCTVKNRSAKIGRRLLQYIETNHNILDTVESTFVHFDIWDGK